MPSAMPSAMPIVGANSGTSTTAAARPTRLELTASPPIAIASGSPAATTEPNMMRRITAAAISPIISARGLVRLGELHGASTERDVQPVALGRLRGGQQPFGVFDRHVVGVGDIEIDAGDEGPAVRRDGTLGGVGILDGRDVRHASQLTEERVDPTSHLGAGDVVGTHHHLHRVAGLRREPLAQQALRLLGIRARRGGAVGELAAEGRRQPEGDGERHGPGEEHPSPPAVGQARESAQRSRPRCVWCHALADCRAWTARQSWDLSLVESRKRSSRRRPGCVLGQRTAVPTQICVGGPYLVALVVVAGHPRAATIIAT